MTPRTSCPSLSYCGGVPKETNAFRYKFSWSPIGVLRALRTPSKSIRNWTELAISRPWNALTSYVAPLPHPETFEVYPNRDSLPFIAQYHFAPEWRVKNFVRGTIRLMGWADAWAPIFTELETLRDRKATSGSPNCRTISGRRTPMPRASPTASCCSWRSRPSATARWSGTNLGA